MRGVPLIRAIAAATLTVCVTVLLLVLALSGCAPADDGPRQARISSHASLAEASTTTSSSEPPSVEITIAAAGDLMIHKVTLRAAAAAGPGGSYDFKPTFARVAPYLRAADYTVLNLETRLAGSELAYTSFPKFNCPDELTDALRLMGVDLCATANNHALDKGWVGVVNTLDRLDEAGIAHMGTYRSLEEKNTPFIVDIKGVNVAFINYTDSLNTHDLPHDYAVNYMEDRAQIVSEVRVAREAGADVVILFIHWGKEYLTNVHPSQRSLALGDQAHAGLLQSGVDVILGAHPHVVQPAEGVVQNTESGPKNTYVVYSMGNFSSDMVRWRTDSGVIVYVHMRKTGDKVEVTGLSYMAVYRDQYGSYPRQVVVEPLLPGVVPISETLSGSAQRRLNEIWRYVTEMYYDPGMNIVPLAPAWVPDEVCGDARTQ